MYLCISHYLCGHISIPGSFACPVLPFHYHVAYLCNVQAVDRTLVIWSPIFSLLQMLDALACHLVVYARCMCIISRINNKIPLIQLCTAFLLPHSICVVYSFIEYFGGMMEFCTRSIIFPQPWK